MKIIYNITILIFLLVFVSSCKKDIDNLKELDNVTAPTNVTAIFDITQDNTGLVTIVPDAEGVTSYKITFGDVADETSIEYGLNELITHNYTEGVYTVGITAVGLTGLTSNYSQEINVTFVAPEDLEVSIIQDVVNPSLVTVSALAKYATIMDIYFGDVPDEDPVHALPGEVVEHTYIAAGDYTIRVVAKSAGEATNEESQIITISSASDPVLLPITFESFTVNYAFTDFGNVISTVIDNPYPEGINSTLRVAQSVKPDGAETWGGSFLTLGEVIDFSTNKLFKVKVWSPKSGAVVKLKVENLDDGDIGMEVDAITTVSNQWEELEFDFSAIDISFTYQKVVIFFDFGNAGDDAIYYFDDIKLTSSAVGTGLVGTWKMAPEAGSYGVGPGQGDLSWWQIDEAGVILRACFFDDTYVFDADGSFSNVLGTETWVEGWQNGGGDDGCASPVAPHDGSAAATYTYDAGAGTVTVNGIGAYLGIPKPYNGGELTVPSEAPESITYIIELSDNDTRMTLDISIGGDGWWRFILVKEGGGGEPTPLDGIWQVSPEAESLGVGPGQGDISWWSIDDAGVDQRGCFFDDTYVFGADGSFSNVLGAETWVEVWQSGVDDACGAPVAPHDGSVAATFSYDAGTSTVTINGTGAYLGIPKPYNGGELASPDEAPEAITYIVELSENNTVMIVDIAIGGDGWWRYKLVKN